MSRFHLSSASRPPAVTGLDLALASVRLGLALVFIFHGSQKLFGLFGGAQTVGLGAGIVELAQHIGPGMAWATAIGEFTCGVLMLLGLASRVAAGAIVLIMIGAIASLHWANGFPLVNPHVPLTATAQAFKDGMGYEYELVLITMALAIGFGGAGKLSLGQLLPPGLRRFLG